MTKVNNIIGIKISVYQKPATITVGHIFENNKLHLRLLCRPIETIHDIKKLAKSILDITGGIYFSKYIDNCS
jgi:hypothetical protein